MALKPVDNQQPAVAAGTEATKENTFKGTVFDQQSGLNTKEAAEMGFIFPESITIEKAVEDTPFLAYHQMSIGDIIKAVNYIIIKINNISRTDGYEGIMVMPSRDGKHVDLYTIWTVNKCPFINSQSSYNGTLAAGIPQAVREKLARPENVNRMDLLNFYKKFNGFLFFYDSPSKIEYKLDDLNRDKNSVQVAIKVDLEILLAAIHGYKVNPGDDEDIKTCTNIEVFKSESSNRYEDMLVTYQLADIKVIETLNNKYGNKFKAKGARRFNGNLNTL